MIVRFDSVPVAIARRAAHVAIAAAFLALSGVASAQGGTTAQAASAAAPAVRVIGKYPVKPGQSLHSIAADLTQSRDKDVIARVSGALFEANPGAFAKHDPSRLKTGAVLNVPAVPEIVAAAPQAASAAPATPAAVVSAPAAPAAPVEPVAPVAPVVAAHGAAPAANVAPATAQGASAAANQPANANTAASGPSASASAAATASGASAPAVDAAAQAAALAASGASATSGASGTSAASQPAAATSPSDAHVWTGAVQAAPAASAASGAAHAPANMTLSSLQQLLALKNRVLMALQQHGIGKHVQSAGAASGVAGYAAAAPGGNGAAGVAAPGANESQFELSPVLLGVAGAVGVAVFALIFVLFGRRRKARVDDTAEAAPTREEPPVLDTPLVANETPVVEPDKDAALAPAQRKQTLDRATNIAALTAAVSSGDEAAQQEDGSSALREDRVERTVSARGVERGVHQTLADASEAAGFAAAAELGASALSSALSPEHVAAPHVPGETEELERAAEQENTPDAHEAEAAEHTDTPVHAEPASVAVEPTAAASQPAEPQPAPTAFVAEPTFPLVPPQDLSHAEVPGEFPPSAVSALDGIDMLLPPRVAQPVASPEATAAQAVPLDEPLTLPPIEEIVAGVTGPGATAGLGAPRFGALTLDFDLNLPPDSAEPLPVFTPDQLARIARNKLELAREYIALGDLAGARALINEVIESNDRDTRADAQTLLSTLAPLS
ncbi:FimV/HubP family polar landmark protein [Paraburkholderia denitrificans]|uniref:FimV/HubP family polar landmark protein n=1 Tax=Paraburkholderia denitrificans TaxID=694025 RepID=A0ABW0J3F1_9BURK